MNILLYALLWLSFGLGHSITAKISVQQKFAPDFLYYRLCYNAFATAHIMLVLYMGSNLLFNQTFAIFANTVIVITMKFFQLAGFFVVLLALRQYDLKEFLGISPLLDRKERSENTPATRVAQLEPLNTSGLNNWVRHPLYSGVFIYLWGGAASQLGFFTALFGSLYLIIGSRHEEKKLVRLYGDAYRRYQQSVPRFIPSWLKFKSTHF